jgi:hypothetical protein
MLPYLILTIIAVATRLLPHAANVAPIGGLALFLGATALNETTRLNKTAAFAVPIIALFVSDILIGFYTWEVMVSVYAGFILTLLLGLAVRKFYRIEMVVGASIAASIIFFLLTNAAVWAFTPMYHKTLAGLMQSYTMALPFFRNSLFGDLAYSAVLFGAYELAIRPRVNGIKLKSSFVTN